MKSPNGIGTKRNVDFSIVFTNADCLFNKRSELNMVLQSGDTVPRIVVIADVLSKFKANEFISSSEFSLGKYNILSNHSQKILAVYFCLSERMLIIHYLSAVLISRNILLTVLVKMIYIYLCRI